MKMTTPKQKLLPCLLLSCLCYHFIPVQSFAFQRIAYPKHSHRCQENVESIFSGSILRAQNNPENDSEEPKTEDDRVDPVEELLAMQEASNRVTNRLLLPGRIFGSIGESIRFLAIAFLVFSYGLNFAGYSLLRDDDSLRIGTLEDRNFQMEITRSLKDK
jgi:hypothetical protein